MQRMKERMTNLQYEEVNKKRQIQEGKGKDE